MMASSIQILFTHSYFFYFNTITFVGEPVVVCVHTVDEKGVYLTKLEVEHRR